MAESWDSAKRPFPISQQSAGLAAACKRAKWLVEPFSCDCDRIATSGFISSETGSASGGDRLDHIAIVPQAFLDHSLFVDGLNQLDGAARFRHPDGRAGDGAGNGAVAGSEPDVAGEATSHSAEAGAKGGALDDAREDGTIAVPGSDLLAIAEVVLKARGIHAAEIDRRPKIAYRRTGA